MNGFHRKVIADVTNFSFDFIHYYHYSFISLLIPMDCKLVFIYVILTLSYYENHRAGGMRPNFDVSVSPTFVTGFSNILESLNIKLVAVVVGDS